MRDPSEMTPEEVLAEMEEIEDALTLLDIADYLEAEGFIEIEGDDITTARAYPTPGVEVWDPSN